MVGQIGTAMKSFFKFNHRNIDPLGHESTNFVNTSISFSDGFDLNIYFCAISKHNLIAFVVYI